MEILAQVSQHDDIAGIVCGSDGAALSALIKLVRPEKANCSEDCSEGMVAAQAEILLALFDGLK